MNCTILGIDVAKNVFQLHGVNEHGQVVVRLVRPYVKGTRHDSCEAEAICEAVGRPHIGSVQLKTLESQDIQTLHRIRSRLIRERTAMVNQVRSLLRERGIGIAPGVAKVRQQLPAIVEDVGNALTPVGREVMQDLHEQMVTLDQWIIRYDRHCAVSDTRARANRKSRNSHSRSSRGGGG